MTPGPKNVTTTWNELVEARERLKNRMWESSRASVLARASQMIGAAAVTETKPLVLRIPGVPSPSDPGWADFQARCEADSKRFSSAEFIALHIASDPVSQDTLEQAAVRVREAGIKNDSSPMLVLLVVLMWIIAAGFPIVQTELPAKEQGIAINEVATVGVALAITWRVLDKRKKSDDDDDDRN